MEASLIVLRATWGAVIDGTHLLVTPVTSVGRAPGRTMTPPSVLHPMGLRAAIRQSIGFEEIQDGGVARPALASAYAGIGIAVEQKEQFLKDSPVALATVSQ